jgi:hypothetical protein
MLHDAKKASFPCYPSLSLTYKTHTFLNATNKSRNEKYYSHIKYCIAYIYILFCFYNLQIFSTYMYKFYHHYSEYHILYIIIIWTLLLMNNMLAQIHLYHHSAYNVMYIIIISSLQLNPTGKH